MIEIDEKHRDRSVLINKTRIINETRQVGICPKCNSSLIRKYWVYLWGEKRCINPKCK